MPRLNHVIHDALLRSADQTEARYAHTLLTKFVPVNVEVCLAIGVKVSPEALEKFENIVQRPNSEVLTLVKLSEYLDKLREYDPDDHTNRSPAAKPRVDPVDIPSDQSLFEHGSPGDDAADTDVE